MSQGELGVLHTDASYAPLLTVSITNNKDIIDFTIDDAIDYLRGEELKFYHSIFPEVSTLAEFLAKIRALFKQNANDAAILQGFKNVNLQKFLPDYEAPVFERGYRLIITGDAELINFAKLNSEYITVENGEIYVSIIPKNAQFIKRLLNKGLNRTQFNAFKDDNDNITRNLNQILDLGELTSKHISNVFTIEASHAPVRKEIEEFDVIKFARKKNSDKYWTKDDLKNLRKNPNSPAAIKARQEIQESVNYIHDFLFKKYNQASENMRTAMDMAWTETMGPAGTDVLAQDFFFEGKNYTKTVLGQIGEFANHVFDNFLKLNADKSALPPALIKIIGSDFENGQQYHSDIEIMLACGANVNQQTKNINENSSIPVNTNASLIEPVYGGEVVSPLVHYFANTDYRGEHGNYLDDFKKIFEQYFYATMNLNVSSSLNARQMNTFYFIGGEHLVPASEILETLKGRRKTPTFQISGGNVHSYTKDQYEEKFKKHFYWKYEKGGNNSGDPMEASSYNAPAYQTAASNISISTSFSIPALLKTGNFRIF